MGSRTVLNLNEFASLQGDDIIYVIRSNNQDGQATLSELLAYIGGATANSGYSTPDAVKVALESLTGNSRLDVNAILNGVSTQALNTAISGIRQLPAGGSPGQVPTPRAGGGYVWINQSGGTGGGISINDWVSGLLTVLETL